MNCFLTMATRKVYFEGTYPFLSFSGGAHF